VAADMSEFRQRHWSIEEMSGNLQEDSLRQSESRVKELEDEKNRLQKTYTAQNTQLDKYKKLADDRQSLADSLDTQLTALNKVRLTSLYTVDNFTLVKLFGILDIQSKLVLYSITSIGLGADPGFLAVSTPVT